MNSVYACRLADIRYTQGGMDNMELARQYYVHALKLSNMQSLRAAWGALLVCECFVKHRSGEEFLQSCNWLLGKVSGARRKELAAEAQWAVEQIGAIHRATDASNTANVRAAQAILDTIQPDIK